MRCQHYASLVILFTRRVTGHTATTSKVTERRQSVYWRRLYDGELRIRRGAVDAIAMNDMKEDCCLLLLNEEEISLPSQASAIEKSFRRICGRRQHRAIIDTPGDYTAYYTIRQSRARAANEQIRYVIMLLLMPVTRHIVIAGEWPH